MGEYKLNSIEDAIKDFKEGKFVIVVVYGMMLKGWTVAIEKGKTYYCVVTETYGRAFA